MSWKSRSPPTTEANNHSLPPRPFSQVNSGSQPFRRWNSEHGLRDRVRDRDGDSQRDRSWQRQRSPASLLSTGGSSDNQRGTLDPEVFDSVIIEDQPLIDFTYGAFPTVGLAASNTVLAPSSPMPLPDTDAKNEPPPLEMSNGIDDSDSGGMEIDALPPTLSNATHEAPNIKMMDDILSLADGGSSVEPFEEAERLLAMLSSFVQQATMQLSPVSEPDLSLLKGEGPSEPSSSSGPSPSSMTTVKVDSCKPSTFTASPAASVEPKHIPVVAEDTSDPLRTIDILQKFSFSHSFSAADEDMDIIGSSSSESTDSFEILSRPSTPPLPPDLLMVVKPVPSLSDLTGNIHMSQEVFGDQLLPRLEAAELQAPKSVPIASDQMVVDLSEDQRSRAFTPPPTPPFEPLAHVQLMQPPTLSDPPSGLSAVRGEIPSTSIDADPASPAMVKDAPATPEFDRPILRPATPPLPPNFALDVDDPMDEQMVAQSDVNLTMAVDRLPTSLSAKAQRKTANGGHIGGSLRSRLGPLNGTTVPKVEARGQSPVLMPLIAMEAPPGAPVSKPLKDRLSRPSLTFDSPAEVKPVRPSLAERMAIPPPEAIQPEINGSPKPSLADRIGVVPVETEAGLEANWSPKPSLAYRIGSNPADAVQSAPAWWQATRKLGFNGRFSAGDASLSDARLQLSELGRR